MTMWASSPLFKVVEPLLREGVKSNSLEVELELLELFELDGAWELLLGLALEVLVGLALELLDGAGAEVLVGTPVLWLETLVGVKLETLVPGWLVLVGTSLLLSFLPPPQAARTLVVNKQAARMPNENLFFISYLPPFSFFFFNTKGIIINAAPMARRAHGTTKMALFDKKEPLL